MINMLHRQRFRGSKLIKRHTISNMKLEQLNKHEEMSYMEDAEANEAILKNTISKDELCRFLSPLKFLEIETWRKEVPSGDNIDEAEIEHRKWRTPIEILIPSAGREDDTEDLSGKGKNQVNEEELNLRKKKAVSVYGRRRRFFEDVQRQNAQVLHRSNSDATSPYLIRPRTREAVSAGGKLNSNQDNSNNKKTSKQNQNSPENRLRSAYEATNGIKTTPQKESRTTHSAKAVKSNNSGHIYVNHAANGSPLTHDAVMTSYFAPGRPVKLSKLRNRTRTEPSRDTMGSAETGESSMRRLSSSNTKSGLTLTSNSASSPPPSNRRISSSSWPAPSQARKDQIKDPYQDVQVLPFNAVRPQTAGEEMLNVQSSAYQRHSKFRGSQNRVSLSRGWRTWNNRRVLENSLNAASKLYQNSIFPKKMESPKTLGKIKIRESKTPRKINSVETPSDKIQTHGTDHNNNNGKPMPDPDTKTPKSSTYPLTNHVTKISFANGRSQENKIPTSPTTNKHVMGRVQPIPPIDMKVTSTINGVADGASKHITLTGGIKYLNSDGIIQLSPLQNRGKGSGSPWVAEAFNPIWAASEGYYVRQQTRPNKTVTFRLGTT
ncbi:uncharacterized protein LOC120330330 isoform X2 [Styela clava]